jgi:hypothetical protein
MRGLAAVRGAGQRQFLVGQLQRSAAPLATSGSACSTLTAERGKMGGRCRRQAVCTRPLASTTARRRAAVRRFDDAAAPGLHAVAMGLRPARLP